VVFLSGNKRNHPTYLAGNGGIYLRRTCRLTGHCVQREYYRRHLYHPLDALVAGSPQYLLSNVKFDSCIQMCHEDYKICHCRRHKREDMSGHILLSKDVTAEYPICSIKDLYAIA